MPVFLRRKSVTVWWLPLLIAALTMILLLGALLLAASKADEAAARRQDGLLTLIVANLETSVAHDQESATVWDDAVRHAKLHDREWMASNLGEWMHTYFQHDAALVLSANGDVIYDFIANPENSGTAVEIAAVLGPLTERLKRRLVAGETTDSATILSIGESDLLEIAGRAAIVSAKPIVSDSGEIVQEPGTEYIHVAVRYLDGVLPQRMAEDYQFEDLAFERELGANGSLSSVTLQSRSGETVGYFTWKPFTPGASVIRAVSPVILLVGLSTFCLTSLLFHGIWRRSLSLAHSQRELEHLARHDALTGLANRANFNSTLEHRLAVATAERPLAVMFVDLDHFKAVNDTHGHPVGDALIKQVAERLVQVAPSALVCRLGGDEFTLLLDACDTADIEHLADTIVTRLRMPFQIDGRRITVGASVGICLSSPGLQAIDITRHADIALYHAKAAGRNTFAVFGSHMEELLRRRRSLESALAEALETGDGIEVHYQPVFAATDGRISSLEALCRFNHPAFGAVSPEIFIPIAEEAGLIQKLGLFVLENACALLTELPDPDVTVAVNASAIELMSPGYPLRVLNMLARFGIAPQRLEIEITERAAADADGHTAAAMTWLRNAGVKFAVDDFGKGNSSFGQLLSLEVDRIKIDKMFVDGLKHGGGMPLVEAIVQMARHKGLKTTAEGIETVEQRQTLTSLGCDHLQGFQLSRPLDRDHVISLLGEAVHTSARVGH